MRTMLAILLAAGLAAASAAAADGPGDAAPDDVWATVNICDTREHPDQMGIRAGMRGLKQRTRMFMRFRVQFRARDGAWRAVPGEHADTGWRKVASGRRGEHDAGYTISFDPPATGGASELRGVVRFEWRRRGRVVQRDRTVTESGHPDTVGADPPNFSAAVCWIA
jgi:hypothetical protein